MIDDVLAIRDGGPPTPHDRGVAGPGPPRLARPAEPEIVELVPGERIVLDWHFVGPDRSTDPAMATRLTVTFTPTPDGTQLDLIHDRLDGLRDRPGWESALDALVAVGW